MSTPPGPFEIENLAAINAGIREGMATVGGEVFKTNPISIQVPAHIFDACAECGEPITGTAELDYFAEMAWHRDCGPMNQAMQRLLAAGFGRLGAP